MKKILSAILISVATGVAAYAQGTINFVNLNSNPALNAPIFASDGTTRLAGATFQAELLGGSSAGSLSLQGAAASFLTAGGAGYFSGGTHVITGVAEGANAFLQVRAWNTAFGATFAAAQASGQANAFGSSSIFSVATGAPNGAPPTTPSIMVGLTSFSLNGVVPEPSTFALAGLGAGALLLFRRRK